MSNKVLDLFAGCGGLSYGFMQKGFEIVGFVEWWKPAIETFLKNHPNVKHLGTDITKISNEILLGLRGEIDVIIGGPPCQGFSLCGKRDPKDKRNQLYKEFLRFVRIIKPETIVIENVQGLLSMRDACSERVISKILHELIKLDYFVSYKVLKASDYGIAQNRKRLFIIAKKLSLFPEPSQTKKVVMQAIGDLPFEENDLNGHVCFNPSKKTINRIRNLKEGQRFLENYNCSPQRLYADRPSKTVVTTPRFIHPYYHRFLTPRELARLQSFPDTFYFCGSKTSMIKQIGNAVPPLLAKAIADKIKRCGAS
jgi:DNA (cytosine-5)-methyltransferase 1